ncbi:hypothetical protein NQ318_017993 [Aromia moschata]|uniref:EML-like first beta-propeller domain-containing protein n=1 Tax=Aromia moschata TaxID=1265417 RepID=A0AAV8YA19_9CUCU|nr:hypothetical protein NQ318_017993 [Aromia moschata]
MEAVKAKATVVLNQLTEEDFQQCFQLKKSYGDRSIQQDSNSYFFGKYGRHHLPPIRGHHHHQLFVMDLHPSREMVASGQRAGRNRKTQAHIRIWSTETLQTLYVFGMGEFEVGVSAVAFSFLNGGSYVLAVDAGRESILSVWQWQWGHLLGKVAVSWDGAMNECTGYRNAIMWCLSTNTDSVCGLMMNAEGGVSVKNEGIYNNY